MSSITDKVVVITGASSGVGESTAPMAALKVEEWDRMIDVNIRASNGRKGRRNSFPGANTERLHDWNWARGSRLGLQQG